MIFKTSASQNVFTKYVFTANKLIEIQRGQFNNRDTIQNKKCLINYDGENISSIKTFFTNYLGKQDSINYKFKYRRNKLVSIQMHNYLAKEFRFDKYGNNVWIQDNTTQKNILLSYDKSKNLLKKIYQHDYNKYGDVNKIYYKKSGYSIFSNAFHFDPDSKQEKQFSKSCNVYDESNKLVEKISFPLPGISCNKYVIKYYYNDKGLLYLEKKEYLDKSSGCQSNSADSDIAYAGIANDIYIKTYNRYLILEYDELEEILLLPK